MLLLEFRLALAILFQLQTAVTWEPACSPRPEELRFDCYPDENATQERCEERQCCWMRKLSASYSKSANCYFPANYPGYVMKQSSSQPGQWTYIVEKVDQTRHIYPSIDELKIVLSAIGPDTLRIQIMDNKNPDRFQVPFVYDETNKLHLEPHNFKVHVTTGGPGQGFFSIKITRNGFERVVFDSSMVPLIYSDQYIQIGTKLPSDYVYGLGEHRTQFQISANWRRMAFWTRDQATIRDDNLYSNHPFLMSIDEDDNAYGYFMMNANAMETRFQPAPAITYITIGGMVDLFVFMGPKPADVIKQYWQIVKKPQMSPYWALGYHLSRWNYGTLNDLKQVVSEMKAIQFPYDVQWTDIDALDGKRIFTYDRVNWAGLPDFVRQLHSEDKKYMSINDPGIACDPKITDYQTFKDGLDADIYVKWANGSGNLIGEVWPGLTVYPDWTHPNAHAWWSNEMLRWNRTIPQDGLWIDMNEVSSFVYGSVNGCHEALDNPKYVPDIYEKHLWAKTICPSAIQNVSNQYNMHSLYGHTCAMATYNALLNVHPGKRPFIITRSSYSGSAHWTMKWGGDNFATFNDMYYSIPDILNFNMFGFALTGDDMCGFIFDTTDELCTRWHQLGSFYTFMRNHNNDASRPHHPGAFDKRLSDIMKSHLMTRYELLPTLYTCLFEATMHSTMPYHAMVFEYPEDREAHGIDTQFVLARALMIAPVLQDKQEEVFVYFPHKPSERWYTYPEGAAVKVATPGWAKFDAPLGSMNAYMRSGYILPTHILTDFTSNAMQRRDSHFRLYIATSSDDGEELNGHFFWDDGDRLLERNEYNYFQLMSTNGVLIIEREIGAYGVPMIVDEVIVFGISAAVAEVRIDGMLHDDFVYTSVYDHLLIRNINLNINSKDQSVVTWF